jgi:hypothetical protein
VDRGGLGFLADALGGFTEDDEVVLDFSSPGNARDTTTVLIRFWAQITSQNLPVDQRG